MLRHADQRIDLLFVQILPHQIFERFLMGRESLSVHQQLHIVHVHRSSLSQTAIINEAIRNGLHFTPTFHPNIEELARDLIDLLEDFFPDSPTAVRHDEFLDQCERHFSASMDQIEANERETRRTCDACGFWFDWGFEGAMKAKTKAAA